MFGAIGCGSFQYQLVHTRTAEETTCGDFLRRTTKTKVIYWCLLPLRRTTSTPPRKAAKIIIIIWSCCAATYSCFYKDLLQASRDRRTTTSTIYYIDGLHSCTRQCVLVPSSSTAKMGDPNVTGSIINAIKGFAVMECRSRPTENTGNTGGRGLTRAASPCLSRDNSRRGN